MTQDKGFSGGSGAALVDGVGPLIRERVVESCGSSGVPGYLAGVYHDGAQVVVGGIARHGVR
jgi:hypothetical protein